MENCQLLTEDDRIVFNSPEVIFQNEGTLVLSDYQDKYMPPFLEKNTGRIFKYDGQEYRLTHYFLDVIKRGQLDVDVTSGIPISWQVQGYITQDSLLSDDYGPKEVVLLLSTRTGAY